MHVLRADYQLASHMISDYAVGEFGWAAALEAGDRASEDQAGL